MKLIKKIKEKLKYGTFLQSVCGMLYKIGIDVMPYYWVAETYNDSVRLDEASFPDYSFEFFGPAEIRWISQMNDDPYRQWWGAERILKRVEIGNKCFGVKYKGEIAAFMWINFKECRNSYYFKKFRKDEAYIFDVYTIKKFRGRKIASHMRNQAYKALNKDGIYTFYSLCGILNVPSVKSKKQLNGKFLKTVVYIKLFKKFPWRWTIKELKPSSARGMEPHNGKV